MSERTFVITVREAPKSVNAGGGGSRANHFAAHTEKKRWEGLYLTELMIAKVPRGMTFCAASVVVHFKHRSGKGRDEENYRHPVLKPFADAMVRGGFLPDDTREYFQVADFELNEAPGEWPWPRVKSYLTIKLEAIYP